MSSYGSFDLLLPRGHTNNRIKPRVATFVSRSLSHLKVNPRPDIFDDPYVQVLEVSAVGHDSILLFNIYKVRYPDTQQYTMERLFTDYSFPTTNTILVGDMNAHHPWWNGRIEIEKHTSTLVSKMEAGHFHLLNEPEAPTFFQYRSATHSL
ncbi:hypothetical protein BJ508DRAFT_335342 [Ascobolus immersus RN42]|uniref:Endonuclease/exonuclease/phosphatase domain-containing protein n=1 Tax=Ascobolus immersus RN42 TaxID=1160509 RepID=A0A3N4HCU7_ASCIM|nr:hypothetical protein BJ508DRAFT_335342 [Ascobolus immersus RN42]